MTSLKSVGFGVLGALALTAIAGSAQAADIGRERSYKDAGPVDYSPPIGWTGFYIGLNAGVGFDDTDDVEIVDDNFVGGGHVGYNWQGPTNVVYGIEGDVTFADNIDYLATIRGRLGYAFGPTLAYATGGAAFIGFDENNFGDDSDTGWVAGLGLEHKLRDNVSVGVEGLYYGFEGEDNDEDANFFVARARLTYHLGGGYGLK
ncbi:MULTISPECIES: outer membrane beta-barrel protein [Rhodomicrobium]|uniref:outer membrane protein n=1 Tax=Rhodomicrobium TaxID=1068 RepID=UPI000B4B0B51|nr:MULTISPECIES: outer membrane beta-barrel protein [Rhodomicrobium]